MEVHALYCDGAKSDPLSRLISAFGIGTAKVHASGFPIDVRASLIVSLQTDHNETGTHQFSVDVEMDDGTRQAHLADGELVVSDVEPTVSAFVVPLGLRVERPQVLWFVCKVRESSTRIPLHIVADAPNPPRTHG